MIRYCCHFTGQVGRQAGGICTQVCKHDNSRMRRCRCNSGVNFTKNLEHNNSRRRPFRIFKLIPRTYACTRRLRTSSAGHQYFCWSFGHAWSSVGCKDRLEHPQPYVASVTLGKLVTLVYMCLCFPWYWKKTQMNQNKYHHFFQYHEILKSLPFIHGQWK